MISENVSRDVSVIESANEEVRKREHILVIDDDADMRLLLEAVLKRDGFQVSLFESATKALEGDIQDVDLVLSDIKMPEMDGLTLIEELRKKEPNLPIILVTAHGCLESAIQAMRAGAFDYIVKPVKFAELKLSVDRALKFQRLEKDNHILRQEIKKSWGFNGIIGKSQEMQNVFDMVRRVSKASANILINGESGTGKELIARAIHETGPRSKMPFVAINCSAIPGELLESELFGHTRGAFTGAIQNRRGLFEEAQGGVVFLDEIGDMELALQAKLLRVIQERTIKPVGENRSRKIDVQIIAATHKDLKSEITKNHFREDLYYRLAVIPIQLPPLRSRREDIPLMADHFLQKFAAAHNAPVKKFTKAAMNKLICHEWKGNVRELENVIERAVILCDHLVMDVEDIPLIAESSPNVAVPSNIGIAGIASAASTAPSLDFIQESAAKQLNLKAVEKRYIEIILQQTGKKEKAAKILGIDRKTLYRKEKDLGLSTSSSSEEEPGPTELSSHGTAYQIVDNN